MYGDKEKNTCDTLLYPLTHKLYDKHQHHRQIPQYRTNLRTATTINRRNVRKEVLKYSTKI